MHSLADESCQACHSTSPRVGDAEQRDLLEQLPGWKVVTKEHICQLEKVFRFPNFVAALDFANRVGAIAEAANHHPTIILEWGRVSVSWWTYSIQGLHRNDFVMAARTDRLLQDGELPGLI